MKNILIANRGEIAIRIAHSARLAGCSAIGLYSADDEGSPHIARMDRAFALPGSGVAAYLDGEAIVAAAVAAGCSMVHPGYGFLSESADFAARCEKAGLIFVGPTAATLATFGSKPAARAAAIAAGVPVLAGTAADVELDDLLAFFDQHGAVMLKAAMGGGGRGMRPITDRAALADAYAQCRSEALAGFGSAAVYAEQLVVDARHVEVQILGDGTGAVVHLWDRECSLQRQRQKIVEVAPARGLTPKVRQALLDAAVTLGRREGYRGVGTVEFLVNGTGDSFHFIEVNPRLQVEHTVTEAVTGLDIVVLQLAIAGGQTLSDLGMGQATVPAPRGLALQARINAEQIDASGMPRPAQGSITRYRPPSGPGIRVDGYGEGGYCLNSRFDTLLAKVIVHVPTNDWPQLLRAADLALSQFDIGGVETGIPFVRALLRHPVVVGEQLSTIFVERHAAELLDAAATLRPAPANDASVVSATPAPRATAPDGTVAVIAPTAGALTTLAVEPGDFVPAGQTVALIEAMKLEHVVRAETAGTIRGVVPRLGDILSEGDPIFFVEPGDDQASAAAVEESIDLDHIRPDLAELQERKALTLDGARPDAVAKRRRLGYRTARENIGDLIDPDSFVEYGSLVIAGQRLRRPVEELIRTTPADGMVTGIGRINGDVFGPEASRCVVMSYDYTVLAGTQGMKNHEKTDRMYELAEKWRLPVVLFAESGGGRPGDTDRPAGGGIFNTRAFALQGRLSALVPQVGIANGRCFAGAAVLLGCCDVVIATKGSTLGVGGPAMIEGGGLGVFTAEEVGPVEVQAPGGVIDIIAEDEADAVRLARQYLAYFQGRLAEWTCADQRRLRHVVPENRLRAYDVRQVIDILCDAGSVLELRQAFGRAAVIALARIEGRPVGVIANNASHLGGAVDADAADKCSRFMQLCDAFDLPIVVLADTPGNMVGPQAETTGLIRHCCRMFVTGPNLTVPVFSVVLRKGYGLGVMAMVGGHSQASFFTVAWPTGEFGGMGLEGSIKLGYRKEMEGIADPDERERWYQERVAQAYQRGKAISTAMGFDFDEVIDPAETRMRIVAGLESTSMPPRTGKKRPFIDTW